jgi:glutamate-1-semialdehyde-2,1-aminomutase
MDFTKSQKLLAEAREIIPGASQTFSKNPNQFVQGVSPVFLERGEGSHVWDIDGNEFIDYPMALGPIILGHDYPSVTDAVINQVRLGTSFSLPHPLEVDVAKMLIEMIPCAEMVRFGKNGSDVTSAAVRVSRAFTGRDVVAAGGYHGWQDWYIGITTRGLGVPKAVSALTKKFTYNDLTSLESIFAENPGNVACVILEPIGVTEPDPGFLEGVRAICDREGAVLVFDEVITGFRIANGGAQEYFGVTPDLGCFGKAMGNGFPVSAIVGRRDIMAFFDEIFFSFTFGGEAASLAAAKATLMELTTKPVVEHLWNVGSRLKDGYNEIAAEFGMEAVTRCIGLPPRTVMTYKDATGEESLVFKSLFQQECMKRGLLFFGGHNVCYTLSDEDVDATLGVYREVMAIFAEAVRTNACERMLEGPCVEPVFRRA